MIKLTDILNELISTNHYNQRKVDRVHNIQKVIIPKEALHGFNLDQIQKPLIQTIQDIVLSKLRSIELLDIPISDSHYIGYKFFAPVIELPSGKKYPITIITPEGEGTFYYVIVNKEKLITLILSNTENLSKDIDKHLERKNQNIPVRTLESKESIYPINLNKIMGIESKDEKIKEIDLPYKVRTDYRVGANFEHNDYGVGKIVNTSSGTKGNVNSRGIIDWIEVDFGKPYISGGKLYKTRKFNNIYGKPYFL